MGEEIGRVLAEVVEGVCSDSSLQCEAPEILCCIDMATMAEITRTNDTRLLELYSLVIFEYVPGRQCKAVERKPRTLFAEDVDIHKISKDLITHVRQYRRLVNMSRYGPNSQQLKQDCVGRAC